MAIRSALRAALAGVLAVAGAAHADWTLDADASTLGFASVKNGTIAEGHRFHELSGRVDDGGAELVIDLASVDTAIGIRDERMREMLFEVARFPQAVFSADLDPAVAEALAVGEATETELSGTLAMHGVEAPVSASVVITRTADDRVLVASVRPVVVSAAALDLQGGLEKLREVAGLAGITPQVPVTFSLAFRRD